MTKLRQLIHEVHRRSLWQVVGIYGAASWVALQVVAQIAESLGLPEWVEPGAVVLLILGLPVVLATAFIQEGTTAGSGGARRGGGDSEGPVAGPGAGVASEPAVAAPSSAREEVPADRAGTAGGGPSAPGARHRLFTWRNALLGGAAAFLLLGVVTGGYMAMRTLGIGPAGTLVAKGVLEERDRILLSDFEARGADPTLAQTVTEALRVDLAKSEVVRLAEPAFVADALERMARPTDAALDEALALELAEREGIKAVLLGDVGAAGRGYVLTARLVAPGSGEILASDRVAAPDSSDIIPAIDELSRSLRERVGESLRTIRREEPLQRVTTADLEALRKYTQSIRAFGVGEWQRGIALLEESVERDTAFAMAWRKLGVELNNRGEARGRAVEAIRRAYDHRDRLSERERYLAAATYHRQVEGNLDRAARAYESLLELDPDDTWALNNLGAIRADLRDWETAEELFERAVGTDSGALSSMRNAALAEFASGKVAEGEATYGEALRRFPESDQVAGDHALLPTVQGAYEEAESRLEALRPRWRGNAFLTSQLETALAAVRGTRGKLEAAASHHAAAAEADRQRGAPAEALGSALAPLWYDLVVREDRDRALARLEAVLSAHPLGTLDPLERPYLPLVQQYAVAGRPERARRYLEAYEAEVSEAVRAGDATELGLARGALALAEGRREEGLGHLRAAVAGTRACPPCGLAELGWAYRDAGRPDSAVAVLERYVETTWPFRVYWDQGHLGPAYEFLARTYDERGDTEKARLYYAKLTELWADADEELRPRVEAARARLEALLEAGG